MTREHEGEGGPRIIDEAPLYEGFVRLSRVRLDIEWRGRHHRMVREIHDHGHVAAIVPVDAARRMGLLIRQFRACPFLDGEDGWLWEIPAGMLDGEAPEVCAAREAREETGVELSQVEPIGVIWTSPGVVEERVHLFWGIYDGPPPAAIGGADGESEIIEVHELALEEIAARLDGGEIIDAKSAIALHRLRAKHPHLFASTATAAG
jgi:GDP-mannose pyrophosphatase NudK